MSDDTHLRQLYRDTVLAHSREPHNFRRIEGAQASAEGHNPLCGDKVTVHLQIEDGAVRDVGFQGSGCAISTASASLMTEAVKGKPVGEVIRLFEAFHALLTTGGANEDMGKLAVFAGVREYPMRVKCATLAWHTLRTALEGKPEVVKTE
jgi:nitrogen fixation protein NifU and related proteins